MVNKYAYVAERKPLLVFVHVYVYDIHNLIPSVSQKRDRDVIDYVPLLVCHSSPKREWRAKND
jgi:hypothetical protein